MFGNTTNVTFFKRLIRYSILISSSVIFTFAFICVCFFFFFHSIRTTVSILTNQVSHLTPNSFPIFKRLECPPRVLNHQQTSKNRPNHMVLVEVPLQPVNLLGGQPVPVCNRSSLISLHDSAQRSSLGGFILDSSTSALQPTSSGGAQVQYPDMQIIIIASSSSLQLSQVSTKVYTVQV